MSEPVTESGRERAMIEMAPADAAMVESFREAAYAIDHQRDDDPNWRPPNQIIGEAFEQRGLIVARREEVVALREAAALAGPAADRLDVDRLAKAMTFLDDRDPGIFNIVAISEPDTRDVAQALAAEYAALSRSETTGIGGGT